MYILALWHSHQWTKFYLKQQVNLIGTGTYLRKHPSHSKKMGEGGRVLGVTVFAVSYIQR